ncbi:MAG: DctP family TRAP transporter solute-binding subunit [Sphaerochaetaceae bacterium]
MKKTLIILLAFALICSSLFANAAAETKATVKTVKLSIPDPAGSSVGSYAQKFADLVKEKTNGAVVVEVYPDGILFGGDQNAAINMLQDGGLDALILSTSVFASFEPRMNAVSLPYLFSNYDEFITYLKGEPGQELLHSLEDMNIDGLALAIRTYRVITNNKRPIFQPSDLKGIKIRVPNNKLWVDLFKALGADPTPMNFSEVYTALQLSTIDAQENPIEVPLANNFFEVQKYVSMTNHIADSFGIFFNHSVFSKFDDETKGILKECAEAAADFKNESDIAQEAAIVNKLQEKGMVVNYLTPEQIAAFQAEALKLYPSFESMIGSEFVEKSLKFLGR